MTAPLAPFSPVFAVSAVLVAGAVLTCLLGAIILLFVVKAVLGRRGAHH
ncbi:hypothetical protein [Rhodococcus pyridinivorans]|nr:hypothetical protein [Rhodococcus pyridinivorans]USI90171.1 hypothetical protein LLA01_22005 [Rhodococcus pyridinivorans]